MKKNIKSIAVAIILLVTIQMAHAQTTNFLGIWKRNDTKTKVDKLISINSVPTNLQIDQNVKSITIAKTNKDGNGVVSSYSTTLKFDGSESTEVTPSKLYRTSKVLWSADHQFLLETAVSKDDQGNIKQTYKYTYALEEGGKTLKISAELTANEQNYQLTEVFDRQ
ncbi:MAG: hypothetical protein V4592_18050 [Bacteroidota bacterium]